MARLLGWRGRRGMGRGRPGRFGTPEAGRPADRFRSPEEGRRWADRVAADEPAARRPDDDDVNHPADDLGDDHRDVGDGDGDGAAGARVRTGDGPRRPSGTATVMPPRPVRDDPAGPDDQAPRRPLVPEWVRDPGPTVRWWLGDRTHAAAFHVLRLPTYAARAMQWTPRGLTRGVVGAWRWATDAQSAPLRWEAADRGDVEGYLYLSQQTTSRTRARTVTALTIALAIAGGVLVAWPTLLGRLAVVVVVVAVGGWLGRPADRPMFDHPVLAPSRVKITPDVLVEAFCAAKLCNKHEDPDRHQTVTFLQPVHRDGAGWRAVVDLPGGHTASKALARSESIAAGLGVDEVRVFLERVRGDDGSARRVSMWVADRDPYAAKPVVSPLAAAAQWSFWDGVPFGTDARGRRVTIPLVFTNLLVGAIPRMGKTYAARLAAGAAALDPDVRLITFDAKGPDWQPFAQVAHRCGFGPRDAVVEHLVEVLDECSEDVNRRYATLSDLPTEVRPESKVTPGITANRRLDMPLTLICIDEVQEFLGHDVYGTRILETLTRLCKVAPAVGYMLVIATQRPDGDVIKPTLRDNIGTRAALKTMTWQSSETILGAGSYKAGLDASRFQRSHKGVCLLIGADDGDLAEDGPQTVRSDMLDLAAIEALVARGRALRLAAGTLTGAAAGEQLLDDRPRRNILDDIAATFAAGEQKLWSETICARLVDDHPDVYGGWGPPELATALTPYAVPTDQQWGKDEAGIGRNRRGVVRADVTTALAARTDTTPGGRPKPVTSATGSLAARRRLAPPTARSSTPASTTSQATSDLADPATGPDTPGNGDSADEPLAALPQADGAPVDHQP